MNLAYICADLYYTGSDINDVLERANIREYMCDLKNLSMSDPSLVKDNASYV